MSRCIAERNNLQFLLLTWTLWINSVMTLLCLKILFSRIMKLSCDTKNMYKSVFKKINVLSIALFKKKVSVFHITVESILKSLMHCYQNMLKRIFNISCHYFKKSNCSCDYSFWNSDNWCLEQSQYLHFSELEHDMNVFWYLDDLQTFTNADLIMNMTLKFVTEHCFRVWFQTSWCRTKHIRKISSLINCLLVWVICDVLMMWYSNIFYVCKIWTQFCWNSDCLSCWIVIAKMIAATALLLFDLFYLFDLLDCQLWHSQC